MELVRTISNKVFPKGIFIVTASTLIRAGQPYKAAVFGNNFKKGEEIILNLKSSDGNNDTVKVSPHENHNQIVNFNIREDTKLTYMLEVKYDSFSETRHLHKNNKRTSVFIQTDKSTYKPSDKVQFRIIIVDSNTKPIEKPNVQMIFITDGAENRVKQYEKPAFNYGVYQSFFQLSDLPVFGNWKINTVINDAVTTKDFEVTEYVLPKFKVSIHGSSDVHYKFEKIRLTIKAKYTYGKDVKGTAVMTVNIATAYHEFGTYGRAYKTITKNITVDGKAVVELDLPKDLDINDNKNNRVAMIDVVFKDELTGKEATAAHHVKVHSTLYKFDLIKSREKFKPKLPYHVTAIVRNHDRNTPVTDSFEPVKFSVTYYYYETRYKSRDESPSESNDTKSYYILPEKGIAKLDLDLDKKYTRFHIKAKYLDCEKTLLSVSKAETECNEHIMARLLTEKPVLSKPVSIEILSTDRINKISYQIFARGECIESKTVSFDAYTKHKIEIQPSFNMMPKAKMVFSYVTSDAEIISDYLEIPFDNELINYIDVGLSSNQVKPGNMMNISVSTNPNSIVGLLGVDQSVLLLKSGNDLNASLVFEDLAKYSVIDDFNSSNQANYRDFFNSGAIIITNGKKPYVKKPKKSTFSFRRKNRRDDDEDYCLSNTVASNSEIRFKFTSRPQAENNLSWDESDEDLDTFLLKTKEKEKENPDALVEIRKEFPETWLFENLEFNIDETTKTISRQVPDSITSWVITGFSVCPETGLAVSKNPSTFGVFQPFFVSTNLPYSIKRGEVVSIPVTLFNYMDKEQIADVTLFNDENEFEFVDMDFDRITRETKRSKTTNIKANDGTSVSFAIRPLKVGNITIKVVAETMVAGDGVERQLRVEPEGLTHFANDALLIDLRNSSELKKNFQVTVPNFSVPDSIFIEVSAVGDVLGPSIDNLDKLIKIPHGCGEQNMLNFVPNIVVLDYLTKVGKLTDSVELKTKTYMEQGYQRELTYKHDNGAYSAFGKSDKTGSTWLTAFVAKSFEQAAKYIKIDQKIITKAFEFLSETQDKNGSFPENGYVIYKWMQGGSSSGLALTAYTLTAFLESVELRNKFKKTIDRAITYIVDNMKELNDLYSLAVTTYAMQLAKHELKDSLMEKLNAAVQKEGGFMYWSKETNSGKTPNAINIEITAYALLAYIEAGRQIEAIPIMKWLITQRNSNGGFQSTQDTIVGLTALARIAGSIHDSKSDMQISVKPKSSEAFSININQSNVMILQKFDLNSNDKTIEVTATGKGVGIFQFSYRYNLCEAGKNQRFYLDPVIETSSNKNFLHLTVGANFIPDEKSERSNMAVMEVTLPSGFTFDADHLKTLLAFPGVKRVETKNSETVVIVYFDDLDKSVLRPEIKALRTHKVAKQKPAPILIYDYYDNSRRATKFYSTPEISVADIF